MKRILSFLLSMCFWATIAHSAGNEPINPLPDSNQASFRTSSRLFWQEETPGLLGRYFPYPWVYSGGLHGTSASCTSSAFATEAFVAGPPADRVRAKSDGTGGTVAINYAALGVSGCTSGTTPVRVAICAVTGDTVASNYHRASGSNYFINSTDAAPAIPAGCAGLMDVIITAGALTTVSDIRQQTPATLGSAGSCTHNVRNFGAVGDGVTEDTVPIQAAINAAATVHGSVCFPAGTYGLKASLTLKSNVQYLGFGKDSTLKVLTQTAFHIFDNNNVDISNVVIDGLSFDGSINYPSDSTVYHLDGTGALKRNGAIYISRTYDAARTTNDVQNLTIRNSFFKKLAYSSIFIRGENMLDITVQNNYFSQGAYDGSVIWLYAQSTTAAQHARRVIVQGNHLDTNGPQYYYDPSKDDWTASCDGIQLYRADASIIANNTIHKAASIGIRVEGGFNVAVTGNIITEAGNEGITAYNDAYAISIVGNQILNFGRTPHAYGMRNFGGTYVVAREFPIPATAPLPADPTGSSWFITWPYSTTNITLANVITYRDTDYYVGSSTGILPFRGDSGISCTQGTARCVISGNIVIGSSDVDGAGKRLYANEYGISPIHAVNNESSASPSMLHSVISGNTIATTALYSLYHPKYHDRINSVGLLGNATYLGNGGGGSVLSELITQPFLYASETGTVALYVDKQAAPSYYIAGNAGNVDAATVAGFAMSLDADRSVRSYLRHARDGGATPLQLATLLANPIDFLTNGVRHFQITAAGALRGMLTTNGPAGTFTAANASSTVVANTAASGSSIIILQPTNASAGTLLAAHGVHISAQSAGVSFTVGTSDGASAAGTETFSYLLMN